MPTLEFHTEIRAPLQAVWNFHNTIETLFRLTPPGTQIQLADPPEPMRAGALYRLRMRRWGLIPIHWDARIVEYNPPAGFTDEQVPGRGPFRYWQHQHRFTPLNKEYTLLTDRVTYEMPLGWLGKAIDHLFVRRQIQQMFAYRHRVTRQALEQT